MPSALGRRFHVVEGAHPDLGGRGCGGEGHAGGGFRVAEARGTGTTPLARSHWISKWLQQGGEEKETKTRKIGNTRNSAFWCWPWQARLQEMDLSVDAVHAPRAFKPRMNLEPSKVPGHSFLSPLPATSTNPLRCAPTSPTLPFPASVFCGPSGSPLRRVMGGSAGWGAACLSCLGACAHRDWLHPPTLCGPLCAEPAQGAAGMQGVMAEGSGGAASMLRATPKVPLPRRALMGQATEYFHLVSCSPLCSSIVLLGSLFMLPFLTKRWPPLAADAPAFAPSRRGTRGQRGGQEGREGAVKRGKSTSGAPTWGAPPWEASWRRPLRASSVFLRVFVQLW